MERTELILEVEGRKGFVITVNNFDKIRDYIVERSPLFGIRIGDYSMRKVGAGCLKFAYRERVGIERVQHLARAIGLEDSLRCTAQVYESAVPKPAI